MLIGGGMEAGLSKEISIIIDEDGRKIVVINDIRFKGKKLRNGMK